MPDAVGEPAAPFEHATLQDYLVIVHPNDAIGHPPFPISYIGQKGQIFDYSAGSVVYTVLQLLDTAVHCTVLLLTCFLVRPHNSSKPCKRCVPP